MSMDRKLIDTFRDAMNYNGFGAYKFSNINGKNKWNCICSAMDWITVAVDGIDYNPNLTYIGHRASGSIMVLTLILRIALIKEGIEQLHRVFYDTNEVFLNDSCDVWDKHPFGETDNAHFETIRACFGAHPVNIKAYGGQDSGRMFASWSYVGFDDFSVLLYPSSAKGNNIDLSISFEKLEKYTALRYEHLRDLLSLNTETESFAGDLF